jgi:hypothetical protein
MPITCHFKPDERLVIFVHVGVVSDEEFLSTYKAFYEDARFDKSFKQLVDLRHTESSGKSTEVLRKVADFVQAQFVESATPPRIAVIAPLAGRSRPPASLPTHVPLLVGTERDTLSKGMHIVLSGYAGYFNRRQHRHRFLVSTISNPSWPGMMKDDKEWRARNLQRDGGSVVCANDLEENGNVL